MTAAAVSGDKAAAAQLTADNSKDFLIIFRGGEGRRRNSTGGSGGGGYGEADCEFDGVNASTTTGYMAVEECVHCI